MRSTVPLNLMAGCLALSLVFTAACNRPCGCEETPSPVVEENPPAASQPASINLDALLPGPKAPALFVIAGLHGFTEPCGCSEEILQGGIDRIVGTVRGLGATLPAHHTIISGDTFFRFHEVEEADKPQDLARVELLAQSLAALKPVAVGVGPRDFARGRELFVQTVKSAGLPLVSTNLDFGETELTQRFRLIQVNGSNVALMNLLDERAFEEIADKSGLTHTPAIEALNSVLAETSVASADLRAVFFYGDEEAAAELVREVPNIDFVILAGVSEATSSVASWETTNVPKVWSQGRELGVLRLQGSPVGGAWLNAAPYSADDIQRLTELLENVARQIESVRARMNDGDAPPPLLARLEARQAEYQAELEKAQSGEISWSPDARRFLWDTISLAPGLPIDPAIESARTAYNRRLEELNLANATPPPAAPESHPTYVGDATCASCHASAHTQWQSTAHAGAWATLTERDKHFDRECVGCHVTGYNAPGGSSLGFTDRLENVQCESCHGPGSLHAANPTLIGDVLGGIHREVSAQTCVGCHNAEHSPKFDFHTYLPRILGEGHGEERVRFLTGRE